MQNDIYQLSKKPLNADDFISADDFDELDTSFADYLSDWDEDELDKAYAVFPLMGIFERNEDCLTYLGEGDIRKRWYDYATQDKIDETNITSSILRYRLADKIEHPFTLDRFDLDPYEGEPMTSGEFLSYCIRNLNKGDKLYMGAVINYHW